MQTTMTACLVALALGVVAAEARAEGDDPAVGVWSPPEVRAPAASEWSDPGPGHGERHLDEEDEDAYEPPMRSGWGFGGGIALTAVGGSLLTGAALATIPVGYEGNGSGDPGSEVGFIALIGAAATAGGIGLILWSRAPASGPSTALSVGPAAVRVDGTF